MKIEKKHIIIAIVVAVVAYLLWKRSRSVATDGSSGTGASPKTTVEGVLAAAGANSELKRYARNLERSIEKNPNWKQSVMDKAADNGYTYAQQVVLEAIWMKYTNEDGTWKDGAPWGVIEAAENL